MLNRPIAPRRAGLLLAVVAMIVVSGGYLVRWRGRVDRDRRVGALIAISAAAEREGRLTAALDALQRAVHAAQESRFGVSPRVDELECSRRALARAEVLANLRALPDMEPHAAVGVSEAMFGRAIHDPALFELRDAIAQAQHDAGRKVSAAQFVHARTLWRDGEAARAVWVCDLSMGSPHTMRAGRGPSPELVAGARSLCAEIGAERGVIVEPITGRFVRGSAEVYTHFLRKVVMDGLEGRGYSRAPFMEDLRRAWDRRAPFRLSIELNESQGPTYLRTPLPTCRIDGRLVFKKSEIVLWVAPFSVQTRTPVPGLTELAAAKLAAVRTHDIESERTLYNDARTALRQTFEALFRRLPEPEDRWRTASRMASETPAVEMVRD